MDKLRLTEDWWRDRTAISLSLASSDFVYLPAHTIAIVPSHINSEPLRTDAEVKAILPLVDRLKLQKTESYYKISPRWFEMLPKYQ